VTWRRAELLCEHQSVKIQQWWGVLRGGLNWMLWTRADVGLLSCNPHPTPFPKLSLFSRCQYYFYIVYVDTEHISAAEALGSFRKENMNNLPLNI
jgi:hypothetical protein